MPKRRCETVVGITGVLIEGLAMLAMVLLWIALSELSKAFEGATVIVEVRGA